MNQEENPPSEELAKLAEAARELSPHRGKLAKLAEAARGLSPQARIRAHENAKRQLPHFSFHAPLVSAVWSILNAIFVRRNGSVRWKLLVLAIFTLVALFVICFNDFSRMMS